MTFNDLKFYPLGHLKLSRAKLELPNGYGISVITGENAYSGEDTYEVAILHNNEICYDTPLTDSVLGYQTEENINNILKELETYVKKG
jgi:hypothetical protein